MSVFGPGILVGDVAGHGKNVAILLERAARGDTRSGIFGGFDDEHSDRHAAENPVANGKVLRRGEGADRELGNKRASEGEDLLGQSRILFGINHVDAGAEYRGGLALGCDRATMAGGVDAARHAAENNQSLRGEIAGQALSHPGAVGRRMARADHGDAGAGQNVGIAANIKDQRRIVDFLEPGG